MKNEYGRYAFIGVAAFLLLGCQEQVHNPLLGTWALVKTPEINAYEYKMAELSGNSQFTFSQDQVISGKYAMQVRYTVEGNAVSVHYTNGEQNTYVVEGNTFNIEMPLEGLQTIAKVYQYQRSK